MSGRTAIIVGGGISGLSTANLLARIGWHVTVLEQNDQLGGRAGWAEANGFSFDTGPSWYLMPDVFDHYFELLGRRSSDYLDLVRLDPAFRVFPASGQPVTIHGQLERDAATFEAIEPGAAHALRKHVARAGRLYDLSLKHFLYIDRIIPSSFVAPEVLGALPALPRTPFLSRYIDQHFKSPLLRQILEYHAVFLGLSPYEAPSLYALMAHLDYNQGVYYPKGGMYQIIKALEAIGREEGVVYRTATPVKNILTSGSKATGVTLDSGETLKADLVISAADLHHTETKLLPEAARSLPASYWQKAKPSSSAQLMYLGVKGKIPNLAHHNFIFTDDWPGNFRDVFAENRWPQTASMYVSAPSVTDPTVAPAGDENLFVLVPVPASDNPPTAKEQSAAADRYLQQLARAIRVPDLAERIVYKRLFGPTDFSTTFNSWRGNALGLGHTWGQSAWFRPAVKSKRLENFYTVGANARPGIGLPMCLISAEIVLKHLTGDRTAGPPPVPRRPA